MAETRKLRVHCGAEDCAMCPVEVTIPNLPGGGTVTFFNHPPLPERRWMRVLFDTLSARVVGPHIVRD